MTRFFNGLKIFGYLREEANIPLEIIDTNEHEDGGINLYISYIGPLGGQGNNKRVKVDISRSEKLVFAPVWQNMILNYTIRKNTNFFAILWKKF